MIKKILVLSVLIVFIIDTFYLTSNTNSLTVRAENKLNTSVRGIPVLCYHSVNPNSTNEIIITPQLLKKHLTYLKNNGYTTLSLNDLNDFLTKNKPIPKKSLLITFDDGYMDNYYYAFPILKELNMNATIFCITHSLDGKYYLSENAIKIMSEHGIDIASHTINHADLNTLTYTEQLNEMENSKKLLEKITCKKVIAIAYPFGHYNLNSIKAAKNSGYSLAFTTKNGICDSQSDNLQINRIYISSKYSIHDVSEAIKNAQK